MLQKRLEGESARMMQILARAASNRGDLSSTDTEDEEERKARQKLQDDMVETVAKRLSNVASGLERLSPRGRLEAGGNRRDVGVQDDRVIPEVAVPVGPRPPPKQLEALDPNTIFLPMSPAEWRVRERPLLPVRVLDDDGQSGDEIFIGAQQVEEPEPVRVEEPVVGEAGVEDTGPEPSASETTSSSVDSTIAEM